MNSVILPFLMSMILGRTIDLTSYTISGTDIYDDAEYDESSQYSLNSIYNVIQGDIFPYSTFGIPADVVIRIKSNFLSSISGAMGLDGLLKDTSWKYNSVIVSVASVYRTLSRSLKKNTTLLSDWSSKVPNTHTHYANTLFYGGWSVVLFRFQCDIPSDVVAVRKVLTKELGATGNLTFDTLDQWRTALDAIKANKAIRGTVKINTHVYSTVPLKNSITTPESLMTAIKALPDTVGHLGIPLYMELKPLHDLDEKYPVVERNIEMLSELEKLDEMFDDVKNTKVRFMRWMAETMYVFDDEEEEKISKVLSSLNKCIRAFNEVGADISLFKETDRSILDKAYQMYLGGLDNGIATYNLAYRRLKEQIDAECENTFLHKIRGLLRVYDQEVRQKNEVKGGLQECQNLCIADSRCRSIGYAEHASELDLTTGSYFRKEKQCWIYYRSTSTATVHTPNGLSGDLGVYDRRCY